MWHVLIRQEYREGCLGAGVQLRSALSSRNMYGNGNFPGCLQTQADMTALVLKEAGISES